MRVSAKKIILTLVFALLSLCIFLLARTWTLNSKQINLPPVQGVSVDIAAASSRLSQAVQIKTISTTHEETQHEAFHQLHTLLEKSFPAVHKALKREIIGEHTLLYTWQGSAPSEQAIAILTHQDVVPIAPGTENLWQAPPFSGLIKDGFIWGRGAWDNKSNLMSVMEAVELLVKADFKPRQTIYLVMGHDEEIKGMYGAKLVAKAFKNRHVKLDYALDEGLLILDGVLKGFTKPIALIGIAEKGGITVRLTAQATAGHSSMPPSEPGKSAIGMLSSALVSMEKNQMPANLGVIGRDMFETLAPEMSGMGRVVMSNLWLFKPLVIKQLEGAPSTNAMLRTTTALTVIEAGNKENVLPGVAQAKVNFRILPGDTSEGILAHAHDIVNNPNIKIDVPGPISEASKISNTTAPGYLITQKTLKQLHRDVMVAPGLMVGGTDSHHFQEVADNIYRFSPIYAKSEDLPRFHGTNERISLKNYEGMIQFYHQFILNASAK